MQGCNLLPPAAGCASLPTTSNRRRRKWLHPCCCKGVEAQVSEHATEAISPAPIRQPLAAVLFPPGVHGYFNVSADGAQQLQQADGHAYNQGISASVTSSFTTGTATTCNPSSVQEDWLRHIQDAQHWTQVAALLVASQQLPSETRLGGSAGTEQQHSATHHATLQEPEAELQTGVIEVAVVRLSELGFSRLPGQKDTDMAAWRACGRRVAQALGAVCKRLRGTSQETQGPRRHASSSTGTDVASQVTISNGSAQQHEDGSSQGALQQCVQQGQLAPPVQVLLAMAHLDRAFHCRHYFELVVEAACQQAQAATHNNAMGYTTPDKSSSDIKKDSTGPLADTISDLLWCCWRCQQHLSPTQLYTLSNLALNTQLDAMNSRALARCITAVVGLEATSQAQSRQQAARNSTGLLHSHLIPAAIARLDHSLHFRGVQPGDAADLLIQLHHHSKLVPLQPLFIDSCLQAVISQSNAPPTGRESQQDVHAMHHRQTLAIEAADTQQQASQSQKMLGHPGSQVHRHEQPHAHVADTGTHGLVALVDALHHLRYSPPPAITRALLQQLQTRMPAPTQVQDILSLVQPAAPDLAPTYSNSEQPVINQRSSLRLSQLVTVAQHLVGLQVTPGYMFCAQAVMTCLRQAPFSAHSCMHTCMVVGLLPSLLGQSKEVQLAWVRDQISGLEQLTNSLVPSLHAAPPSALTALVTGLAALRYHPGQQFLQWHAARCEQLGRKFSDAELVKVRAAYSALEYRPNTRLAQLLHRATWRLKHAGVLQERGAVAAVKLAVDGLLAQQTQEDWRARRTQKLRQRAAPQLCFSRWQRPQLAGCPKSARRQSSKVADAGSNRAPREWTLESSITGTEAHGDVDDADGPRQHASHKNEAHQDWLLGVLRHVN